MKKIGIVGYSGRPFNKKTARNLLLKHIRFLEKKYGAKNLEIVSGYTNIGIPKIAYEIADEMGITTVGLSAKEALSVDCGLYPVDKIMVVGERFGDESATFIDYIDIMIRVGGGDQSMQEVKHFKEKVKDRKLASVLFEEELEELK